MKTTTSRKTILIALFFLFFFSAITIQAQVAINTTGNPPDASAMLDVSTSSSSKGVLIPRMSWGAIPSSPVTSLLIYVNSGSPPSGNGFYYYDSGTWKKLLDSTPLGVAQGGTGTTTQFAKGSVVFAGPSGVYLEDNNNFFWDNTNKYFGVGTSGPASNMHVYEANNDMFPALVIEQDNISNSTTGDASMLYSLSYNNGTTDIITEITTGIDYDDNSNFEISYSASLSGTAPGAYGDFKTMMRMHTENPKPGITDFNHQSRVRVWRSTIQNPTTGIGVWTPIEFDMASYDEHNEFTLAPPLPPGGPAFFTATEEGYYQVNARTEIPVSECNPGIPAYVSIAIFKLYLNGTFSMYAQGNNLQVVVPGSETLSFNNAPNVSDVVYLQAGESIEIHVFQNFCTSWSISPGQAITYASVHKVS